MADDQQQVAGPPAGQSAGPVSYDEFMKAAPSPASTAGAPKSAGPVSYDDFMKATPETGPSAWDSGIVHAGNAMTFGMLPKAVAGVMHLTTGRPYADLLDAGNRAIADEQEQHPIASTLGTVGGAVASPIGLGIGKAAGALISGGGLLAGVGRGVLTGGASGAAYGAGSSDWSNPADVENQAGKGALYGAAVGGPLALAGGLAGKAWRLLRPPTATDQLSAAAAAADPATGSASRLPADQAQDLTRSLRGQSPQARQTIDDALNDRAQQQFPRIQDALGQSLGVNPASLHTDIADQITQAKSAAAPYYTKAYAAPDITDPAVVEPFLKIPRLQEAYAAGNRIAEAEPGGSPLPPLPKGTGQPQWVQQMTAVLGRPPTPQELAAAVAHNPQLATQPGPGISVRALDYAKRGLNDIINSKQDGTSSVGRSEARALQGTLKGILGAADQSVSDYGQARSLASSGFGLEDAAALGRQHFATNRVPIEDVNEALAGFSPAERSIYTQAAAEQTLNNLKAATGSATGKADLVSKLWSSIGGQDKLEALAPTPAQGKQLAKTMEDLAGENAARDYIVRGSQTAPQGGLSQFFKTATPSLHTGIGMVKGNPMAWLKAASGVAQAANKQTGAKTAEQLAGYLTQPGNALADVLPQATKVAAAASRPGVGSAVLQALARASAVTPTAIQANP